MREYILVLKHLDKYFKFNANDNNEAIEYLRNLGVSFTDGDLDELTNQKINKKFMPIHEKDLYELAKKNDSLKPPIPESTKRFWESIMSLGIDNNHN